MGLLIYYNNIIFASKKLILKANFIDPIGILLRKVHLCSRPRDISLQMHLSVAIEISWKDVFLKLKK